ncbi:MAG TPA: MFS transporter [Acidimicrobiia bacterium]|nr:MFS transporter [Acidimicrobiia bacterium]
MSGGALTANKKALGAWLLYDLANTIFALGVIGLYFPAWLREEGGRDGALAITEAAAGIAVIALAAWIGARSDRIGRRLPFLAVATAVAIIATSLLGRFGLTPSLVILGFGLVGFNLGSALYDALLSQVSNQSNRGRVSGLGVATGYLGSFVGLGLGRLTLDRGGYALTFRSLAVAFLVFAIPLFVWLREIPLPAPARGAGMIQSWRAAASQPGLTRFLLGRFLYTDAINTLIGGFLALFVISELGLSTDDVNTLLAIAIVAAIGGGLLGGRAATRIGARRSLRATLLLWAGAILAGSAAAIFDFSSLIWIVGVMGGLALGATWASDRVLMYELSPPERLGEFYGLYATVGRFATIVGPLIWALIVDVFRWGRPAAMVALAVFVLAGRQVIGSGVSEPVLS